MRVTKCKIYHYVATAKSFNPGLSGSPQTSFKLLLWSVWSIDALQIECLMMKPNPKSEALSRNLPPELLSDIFTIVCGDYVYLPPEVGQYPWILGHICSYWRRVLWDTPSVWKKIDIASPCINYPSLKGSTGMAGDKAIKQILIFILEKINSSISLTIRESTDIYLNIIVEQPERFSALDLADISEMAVLRLLDLPPTAFSALEHFTFTAPSSIGRLILERITSPFHAAPKLRSIKYLSNGVDIEPQVDLHIPFTSPFPWSRLEDIMVEHIALSLAETCAIWKNSPNLRSCHFLIQDGGGVPTQQIILSDLSLLHLTTYDILDWDDILRPIMAPSLEILYIDAPKFHIPALISLISRSRCLLDILDVQEDEDNFDGEEITGSVARDLIHRIPAVTIFMLSRTFPTFAIQSISDGALPHLQQVSLCVSPEGFSSLLDMINVYLDKSQTLPSFNITCNRGPGFDEVRVRYRTCRGLYEVEGVRIHVRDGESFANFDEDPVSDYSDYSNEE